MVSSKTRGRVDTEPDNDPAGEGVVCADRLWVRDANCERYRGHPQT